MGEGLFIPYVYVPSARADYVKLVTPWGNVKLNKGFMEQLAVSVAVIVLTVMLWRCSARLNATLKKRGDEKEKEANGEEEDEEDEEEDDDDIDTVDEEKVKKGENRYYYSQETNDKKTTVSYGWSDSKKSVSIYLTDDIVTNMKKDQLELKWTNMSLSMSLRKTSGGDQAKSLEISNLFQEITDATWETSKDTLTIILTKAQEIPWTSLNGAARRMEDHIEYDNAFYD